MLIPTGGLSGINAKIVPTGTAGFPYIARGLYGDIKVHIVPTLPGFSTVYAIGLFKLYQFNGAQRFVVGFVGKVGFNQVLVGLRFGI